MKKIGFLSFGHWSGGLRARVPDGGEAVRQTVELAVAAEREGFDGAWVRVHHFSHSLSAPFPLLAAMAARTTRIDVGTAVVDLRYENPLYMAEEAGIVDQLSRGSSGPDGLRQGRLQLGIGRGSPEPAADGQERFGYFLKEGQTWAEVARERAALFRKAVAGAGLAVSNPLMTHGEPARLPVAPLSPGLEQRIWWGAGSRAGGEFAGAEGMNMVSSTLMLQDDGRPFHIQQADQIAAYREAYAASGRDTGGQAAVVRSAFPLANADEDRYVGHLRETEDTVGHLDGGPALSGPAFTGPPAEVAERLAADDAVSAADYVLFALPSQFGVDYCSDLMANLADVARDLGWKG